MPQSVVNAVSASSCTGRQLMCTSTLRVCHLDCIIMWQIEREHNVCCHNADMTVWQIGCIIWQPHLRTNCARCHIMSVARSCLLSCYSQYKCGIFNVLQMQFFCFATLAFVICEHTVPVFSGYRFRCGFIAFFVLYWANMATSTFCFQVH